MAKKSLWVGEWFCWWKPVKLPGQERGNCWFSQDPVESWGVLMWLIFLWSICLFFYVAPGCQDRNPILIIFYRDIWKDLQPPSFQDLWSHDISWWRLIWRCVGGGTGAERDYLDAFTRGQLKVLKALNGGSKIVDRSRYSHFSSGGLLWMRWLASCSWICLWFRYWCTMCMRLIIMLLNPGLYDYASSRVGGTSCMKRQHQLQWTGVTDLNDHIARICLKIETHNIFPKYDLNKNQDVWILTNLFYFTQNSAKCQRCVEGWKDFLRKLCNESESNYSLWFSLKMYTYTQIIHGTIGLFFLYGKLV